MMPREETQNGMDPRVEYERRLAARKKEETCLDARHARLSYLRVALFASFFVLLYPVFGPRSLSAWFLAAPWLVFVPLAFYHESVLRARRRAARGAAYYQYGLDRLDDAWMGRGHGGARFLEAAHPYAADLDVFGEGSLFELINQARTRAGEVRLAAWLCEPASPEEIVSRQRAVEELRDRLDLREAIALEGAELEVGVHPEPLVAWGEAPVQLSSVGLRGLALALTVLSVVTVCGWAFWGWGPSPFLAVTMAQLILRARLRVPLSRVARETDEATLDLRLLSAMLRILEHERFESPRLRELVDRLRTDGHPPSHWIRRLALLVDCLEGRRNSLFAPIVFLSLWDIHFSFAVEAWRARFGRKIAIWLDAVADFEALSSIAALAYERPQDTFPEFRDERAPLFDGTAIGHPLLPEASCIRNDVRLDEDLRLLVVSGSNMSGKSTFLRTIGALAVLAQAGAPVRATRLVLSPLAVGASIRVQDSVQSGVSRFYAEILRLRSIVEMTEGARPLLYLVDEALQGTNSHDRRIGVEAVLRDLVGRRTIGLVTTHDLALTQIADSLGSRAENVHFQDELIDGEMVFDYRLHPGVVARSNALALMRAIGLDVSGAEM